MVGEVLDDGTTTVSRLPDRVIPSKRVVSPIGSL